MINDVAIPIASTIAGGGVVGIVAKVMIQSWFRQHAEMLKSVQTITVSMARLEEKIENFRKSDEIIRGQERQVGIISARLDRIDQDIKGLAAARGIN